MCANKSCGRCEEANEDAGLRAATDDRKCPHFGILTGSGVPTNTKSSRALQEAWRTPRQDRRRRARRRGCPRESQESCVGCGISRALPDVTTDGSSCLTTLAEG